VKRFEQRGLKITGLKMVKPSPEHINDHYPKDEEWIARLGSKGFKTFAENNIDPKEKMGTDSELEAGKMVREWLTDYILESPVVAMVIEGYHAGENVRKIVGSTRRTKADIGTIRGDFAIDSPVAANLNERAMKNLVHASETTQEAEHEISHWFSEEEIYEYNRVDHMAMF
jgi:nucleoside-diphosphate kinase